MRHFLLEFEANYGQNPDKELAKKNEWASECLYELEYSSPELTFLSVLELVAQIKTREQAAFVGAGSLENIIAKNGDQFIDRIEEHARKSPRFRYVLTGVWPQGQQDSPVWVRVEKARKGSPTIDETDQLPEF
ncbi:MAG: hypothetical protein V3V25_04225 [Paracoccaceae bacterium]